MARSSDEVAGDTSRLQFSDPRLANGEFQQLQQQLQQRFSRPHRAGDSAAVPRAPGAPCPIAVPGGTGMTVDPRQGTAGTRGTRVFGTTSLHPYLIEERAWVSMSPQEQALVRSRWDRLSQDQQRRLMRDIRLQDSTRFKPPIPPRP